MKVSGQVQGTGQMEALLHSAAKFQTAHAEKATEATNELKAKGLGQEPGKGKAIDVHA